MKTLSRLRRMVRHKGQNMPKVWEDERNRDPEWTRDHTRTWRLHPTKGWRSERRLVGYGIQR